MCFVKNALLIEDQAYMVEEVIDEETDEIFVKYIRLLTFCRPSSPQQLLTTNRQLLMTNREPNPSDSKHTA
jgi:hypothetical protein